MCLVGFVAIADLNLQLIAVALDEYQRRGFEEERIERRVTYVTLIFASENDGRNMAHFAMFFEVARAIQ